jgi:transcriptional regulator with XRE-family HTH domain
MTEIQNGNNSHEDVDADIRERLQTLTLQHPQAEIARLTGISRANISRYLSGNRIPATVCAGIAKALGVNPSWLLLGEGSPYVSDIHAGHADMATDLLEVVEAMNAVSRMRLGALTGKQHLKALRELDDALRRYESLRDKLNEHSRPILIQLLDDWDKAWADQHPAQMRQLRRAAEQVARLCDDEDLEYRLLKAQAMDDLASDIPGKALETQRRVAQRAIMRSPIWDQDTLTAVMRVTYLLEGAGRTAESIAMCRAARELAEVYGAKPYQLAVIDAAIGDVLTETGRIDEGLPLLQRAMSFLEGKEKVKWRGPWAHAQFFSGALEFDQLAVDPGARGNQLYGDQLLRIAVWLEDPAAMKRASEILATLRGDATNDPSAELTVAKWLMKAENEPGAETARAAMAELAPITEEHTLIQHAYFLLFAYQAQIAWACNQPETALELIERSSEEKRRVPAHQQPMLIAHAIFHRQVIRQLEKSEKPQHKRLHEEAVRWFQDHYKKGYGRFRNLAAD